MTLFKNFAFAAAMIAAPLAGAQAQYFSGATAPDKNATPFWDVTSQDDGDGCNIGYVLTGTNSGCVNNKLLPGYTAPYDANFTGAWFAHAANNVNASVGFYFFAGAGANLTYFGGVAGAQPLRQLAIRDLSTNTILHLFDKNNTTYTFSGPGFFDIGIATDTPFSTNPNFFSWTNVTPNQFAVFGSGATYGASADCGTSGCWVGAEDIATKAGDYDYNDGVLRITGAQTRVPEPSSAVLVVGGLMGLAGVARRRKQA